MKTLVSAGHISLSNLRFSPSILLFDFPSVSQGNPKLLHFSKGQWLRNPKGLNCSSGTVPFALDSVNYGGWDDPRIGGGWDQSGESNQFRNFLVSLGIDDRKYVFVFLLGFACALAISRVRVSSILVFPASVLVFAVGFSFGLVRGGSTSEVSLSSSKKRSKDENYRLSIEKLRNLIEFFDGFDIKVNNLKHDIERAIHSNRVTVGDLQSYVKGIESLSLSASQSRNEARSCIEESGSVNQEIERISNQKASRRRKDTSEPGFYLLQLVGGLFGEYSLGSKPSKQKDAVTREPVEVEVDHQTQGNIMAAAGEKGILNRLVDNKRNENRGCSQDILQKSALDWDDVEKLGHGAKGIKTNPDEGKINQGETVGSSKRFLNREEYSYQSNRIRIMNDHRVSLKMDHHNEIETWASNESLLDSVDFSVSLKHIETEAPFRQENILKKQNGARMPSDSSKNSEDGMYSSHLREEGMNPNDDSHLDDHHVARESEVDSSSSPVSDDVLFDRYLSEANDLLKQARESIRDRSDGGHAESRLYKSAKLLSKAITMKPMSLLAVGQLGNTYLLHGELKLKISRELRTLLSRNDRVSINRRGRAMKGLDVQFSSKDKIASVLVDVCEECEHLLVEAGRKYRMALSIDGNDVRALYNWGLALSFRAQLIADIGPETAFDADKVFMAAIDKFDAMMSKGNIYAPDALFRWGVALQQRSRLRPSKSKEKVKLLQQAKRLFEDALDMDSDNFQVREALSSCISELSFRRF